MHRLLPHTLAFKVAPCSTIKPDGKSKYGGMNAAEVKRLKALEEENRSLKQLVGEQTLDIQPLKAALNQKY